VTLKHLAMNDFRERAHEHCDQAGRAVCSHELELQAFEKGIEDGHAGAIMCAYSRISQSDTGFDTYSCGNNLLLNTVARGHLGFTGWVLTDFRRHPPPERPPLRHPTRRCERQTSPASATNPIQANLPTPPFNANVFANGAGFPGGAPGSGKTLTQAVLNGTNAILVNGNYPPIPAVSGTEWAATLDRAIFHILTSMNPRAAARGNALRLAEQRLHGRGGELQRPSSRCVQTCRH